MIKDRGKKVFYHFIILGIIFFIIYNIISFNDEVTLISFIKRFLWSASTSFIVLAYFVYYLSKKEKIIEWDNK